MTMNQYKLMNSQRKMQKDWHLYKLLKADSKIYILGLSKGFKSKFEPTWQIIIIG